VIHKVSKIIIMLQCEYCKTKSEVNCNRKSILNCLGARSVLCTEENERRAYFGTSMIIRKASFVCFVYARVCGVISSALIPKN
jgi:hypothetical protein